MRQNIFICFINNLISKTKTQYVKVTSIKDLKQFDTLSWSYYERKFKKIVKYSFIIVGIYVSFAIIFFSSRNLSLKTWTAPVVTFWLYFIGYLKSVYIQKFFKRVVEIHRTILPQSNSISSYKIDEKEIVRRNTRAWILSGAIVLSCIVLYLLKYGTLFNVVTVYWFAFLYPALRLTIDLNIKFNKFSSALEKATSNLFPVTDAGH